MRILNPAVEARVGKTRHALFDFDGTISLLRAGWEEVMIPLMLEMISPGRPPAAELEAEVRAYVDHSTGILTIRQMEWLAEAVARHGLNTQPLSAAQYKAIYRARLLERIRARVEAVAAGRTPPDEQMVAGARSFLAALAGAGVRLYLASGTDHADVLREAEILGVAGCFEGRIYGALDASEAHDKEQVVRRILAENHLRGDELVVFGDGPVEMRVAVEAGALAVGVASDEVKRAGWNEVKAARLQRAGADALIADFEHGEELSEWLAGG